MKSSRIVQQSTYAVNYAWPNKVQYREPENALFTTKTHNWRLPSKPRKDANEQIVSRC
jgi:hypothetical protein